MQPFLSVSCPVEGFLYVNGRLWGMASRDGQLVAVSRTGAVYLEFKPSVAGFLPIARGFCLSGGRLVEASVPGARGMTVVAWPESVFEIALEPEPREGYASDRPAGVRLDGNITQRVTPLSDEVGHALIETFREDAGGTTPVEREIMWDAGGPNWPATPESTAVAAAQAAILGLPGETSGYVAHGRADVERALTALYGAYDGCARAVYRPARDAVALVKVVSPNLAKVDYAYYTCVKQPGPQGAWKVDGFGTGGELMDN